MAEKQTDPYKTMYVCKHNGKEVGRIPATAVRAPDYINELASHYGDLDVEYVYDEHASLFAEFHGGNRFLPRE